MRGLALLLLLAGACRPDSDYNDDMAVLDLYSACAPGCDNCMDNQICYGGALPSQATFLSATCLDHCTTSDDCMGGGHCVLEPSVYGFKGPVCMTDSAPMRCPGSMGPTACPQTSECVDSMTLSTAFFPASHSVCGRELVHCPGGCSEDSDGGIAAHCR